MQPITLKEKPSINAKISAKKLPAKTPPVAVENYGNGKQQNRVLIGLVDLFSLSRYQKLELNRRLFKIGSFESLKPSIQTL